jgi:hypothetical protein
MTDNEPTKTRLNAAARQELRQAGLSVAEADRVHRATS